MGTRRTLLYLLLAFFVVGCTQSSIPKGSLKPHSEVSSGRFYIVKNEPAKAIKELNKLLNKKDELPGDKADLPELPEVYYLLGESYRKLNNNDKAIENYKIVYSRFKGNPYSALALRKEGLIYRENGDFQKAVEKLKESEKIYPVQFNFETCTYGIGEIYYKDLKDYDNAILFFKKLLEKSPKNIHYELKATNYLALIYDDKKDIKSALFYFQDLVDRFGWSEEARNAIDKVDELEERLEKQSSL